MYHYEQGKQHTDAARCAKEASAHFADFSLEEAKKFAEHYLSNAVSAFGTDSEKTFEPRIFLAGILNQRGKYQEALENLKQALAKLEAGQASGTTEHINALISLGEAYKGLCKYKKAYALFRSAKMLCTALPETPVQKLIKLYENEFMAYIDEARGQCRQVF